MPALPAQLTCLRGWAPPPPGARPAPWRRRPPARAAPRCAAGGMDLLQRAQELEVPQQPGGDGVSTAGARPPPPPPEGLDPSTWLEAGLLDNCEPGAAPLRVAVLLSGGVDSSLALRMLAAAGHAVTAFYLQIWFQEDFANSWGACPWEEDLAHARAACAAAGGVPLEVVPLSGAYWDRVVAECLAAMRAGRTPNPDLLCNSRVKFGAFLEHLEREAPGRFDRVASGHYGRVVRPARGAAGGGARLALAPDPVKDQTYFLAGLSPAQLRLLLLPLGGLAKPQVRALAAAAALPAGVRPDSQGICFLGRVRFPDFVERHLGAWPGPLVDADTGAVVGFHRGFWFHTVGQRRGGALPGGPWYVARRAPRDNAVYVSRRYAEPAAAAGRAAFAVDSFSWLGGERPPGFGGGEDGENGGAADDGAPLYVKVRHGPHLYRCTLEVAARGAGGAPAAGRVRLERPDQGLAAGQYAVFYRRGVCLGCAVIADDGD